MNMNLNNDLLLKLNKLAAPLSEHDSFDIEKKLLSARFISEIQKHLDETSIKKKDLARILGVSPSYITQVFRGEKSVNMDFLTKVQIELGLKFYISTTDVNQFENLIEANTEEILIEFEKALKQIKIHDETGFWIYKTIDPNPDYSHVDNEIAKSLVA